MDATNPGSLFAQVPPSPEPIIARVRRGLVDACDDRRCPPPPELDRAAAAAVHALWNSRVRTFVEVLALRQAREELDRGVVAPASGPVAATATDAVSRRRPDPGLRLDERDTLTLSDDLIAT